ncbi:MAG: hypothetical protein EBQ65_00285 [Chitinophagaceae bacterium]|nr:hypothetical protein [Chitinophagaceae bacterium]
MSALQRYSCLWMSIIFLFVLAGCEKNITQRKKVYFEDAEDGVAENILAIHRDGYPRGRIVRPFDGSNVIGNFNNMLVTIELDSVPSHNMVYVSFDLYIHDNWQSDVWNIRVNDLFQLSTTFSNNPNWSQSYPEWIGVMNMPARSNAFSTQKPGFCALDTSRDGTTHYKIVFARPHTEKNIKVQFNDVLQGSICDRSWSIDNVYIEVINN